MELSSGTYVKNEARASVMESMPLGSWRNKQKAPTERISPLNTQVKKKKKKKNITEQQKQNREEKKLSYHKNSEHEYVTTDRTDFLLRLYVRKQFTMDAEKEDYI